MDFETEFTLDELLRFLDVSLQDLLLPCHFCPTLLELHDKASFADSKLKVVTRDCTFRAACIPCRRKLAYCERQRFLVCTAEGDFVEAMSGTGIVHCPVRCVNCLALLSASEKLLAKAEHLPFFLVRHMWRSSCRLCRHPLC